ncbi:PAS domain-containing sensor histidine kinase [Saccharibacillus deserti]|uniref:PAS domain-containing sensor histidine kinase n=1 Tax=Saccharibacillus deserti TaxID=1634444 RepID=UPI001FE7BD3E|nr:PAS domain-containing protein [Saccharibacillus deserti]
MLTQLGSIAFLTLICLGLLSFHLILTKKREKNLVESQSYYYSFFEQHQNLILEAGLNGVVTGLNPYGKRLMAELGMSCVGKSLVEMTSPAYKVRMLDAFNRAVGGETVAIDQISIHLSPAYRHWHVTYSPAYRSGKVSGVFVTAINRTDKHDLQSEWERKQNTYERIAGSAMDIILVLDPRLVPVYVSTSFEKRLGYDRGPYLFAYSVTEYMTREEAERIREVRDRLAEGECVSNFELKFPRSDGQMIDLECNMTPLLDAAGELIEVIAVLRDVTLRRNAERALLDGEALYLKLQHSLDRFSEDASHMMKISELEQRLIEEFKSVLGTDGISILETAGFRYFSCLQGDLPQEGTLALLNKYREIRLPVGKIFKNGDLAFFVVGERRGMMQLVCLEKPPAVLEEKPVRIWLQTLSRYADSFYENMFKIKDLTNELETLAQRQRTPAWLLRLMYAVSEKERRMLSQDLHDSALQEQIIWYRKLEMLQYSSGMNEKSKEEVRRVCEGLLDVVHQIRTTCHELRPPFLKEWGIGQALETLHDQVQLRADYRIRFDQSGFTAKLQDEQMIALYRINQELLNNAIKHSNATQVNLSLTDYKGGVLMTYEDDGVGIPETKLQNLLSTMGLHGIKERVRSLEGDIQIDSASGLGLTIHIHLPEIRSAA